MHFVIALFCSISQGQNCHEQTFAFEQAALTPMQCALYGQPLIAQYTMDHPGLRLVKFKCSNRKEQGI